MKETLAPKHTQKIGNNYVMWFENSNSYSVFSATAYLLFQSYISSENEAVFLKNIQEQHQLTNQEAVVYSNELSSFLKDINFAIASNQQKVSFISIPKPVITRYYGFGDFPFAVNYASEKLQQLIHPHFEHGSTTKCDCEIVFDIFDADGLLYLFKNSAYIGSYETKNFHLLQGKFSMELTAALYGSSEADWLATFHASTVCNEKEAIMIIGDSGNGKSTLSALLMASGLDLLADDFTPMLAKTQHLHRFPAAISIKKGAFPIIEPLFDHFNSLEPKINSSKKLTVKYLPPSKPFKNSQKNFECHKIVMVNYAPNVATELKACEPETLLQTLIPDSWISPNADHSKLFLDWLKDLEFYQLNYSDNTLGIEKFKELFSN